MGMGEPSHNLEAVLQSIELLGTAGGIGHKNLVFSTVGDERAFAALLANVDALADREQLALADSVAAAFRAGDLPFEAVLGLARRLAAVPQHEVALALVDDGFGFYKLDGGTALVAFAEKAGVVSTVTAAAIATTTKRIYEMFYDGNGTITWYLDGVEVTSMAAGFPTVVLSPSICLFNGEAAVKTGLVEWMRVIQLG
jgi:hypothetical protein